MDDRNVQKMNQTKETEKSLRKGCLGWNMVIYLGSLIVMGPLILLFSFIFTLLFTGDQGQQFNLVNIPDSVRRLYLGISIVGA